MKKWLLFSFVLVGITFQLRAISFSENLLFTAAINGAQVVPPVTNNSNGIAGVMLNATRDTISINMSFVGIDETPQSVGIYVGDKAENGAVLIDLSEYISGNRLNAQIGGTIVKDNIALLIGNQLYIQVNTLSNPDGHMRGQIELEADWNFEADLSGLNEVPEVLGVAYGLGSFEMDLEQTQLRFNIICQELSGPITGAKLFSGSADAVGVEVADISSFINGNSINGEVLSNPDLIENIFTGNIYINILTDDYPEGELRAQLKHFAGISFDATVDGDQMVPPIPSPAKGVCIIRLNPSMDSLFYDVVLDNINSSIDYAHLHIGDYGYAYGALQVDFSSSISGNRIRGFKTGAGITATTIKKLLISNLTLIVHTADYPSGEIRGQIVRFARDGFTMNLEGQQVVTPVSTSAYGSGIISISRDQSNVHYMFTAGNLSSPATEAHLHKQIMGENGEAVYDLTTSLQLLGNDVIASGFWKNTSVPSFTFENVMTFEADSIYIDIHNELYPEGELRGQVIHDQANYKNTVISDFGGIGELVVYPNPVSNHLFVTYNNVEQISAYFEIINLMGEQMYSSNFNSNSTAEVDLDGLSAGGYIIRIITEKGSMSSTFIKN